MDDLLQEYENMFGNPFPLMAALGMSDDEIIDAVEDCLIYGKPYNPNIPAGADI